MRSLSQMSNTMVFDNSINSDCHGSKLGDRCQTQKRPFLRRFFSIILDNINALTTSRNCRPDYAFTISGMDYLCYFDLYFGLN